MRLSYLFYYSYEYGELRLAQLHACEVLQARFAIESNSTTLISTIVMQSFI